MGLISLDITEFEFAIEENVIWSREMVTEMFKLWRIMQREILTVEFWGCENEVYMEKREGNERQGGKRVLYYIPVLLTLMMDSFLFCLAKKQFQFLYC